MSAIKDIEDAAKAAIDEVANFCSEAIRGKNKEIESIRQQLAECQATNLQMRGLVDQFLVENDTTEFGCACHPGEGYTCGTCRTFDRQLPLREALALPNDATALNELIAERTKTQKEYYESVFQDGANRIAELTAEVERLKENYDLAIGITNTTLSVSDELRQQNAELTAKVESYKTAWEQSESTCRDLTGKVIHNLRNENAELTAQRDAAEDEAGRMRAESADARGYALDLERRLRTAEACAERYRILEGTECDSAIDAAIANCKEPGK